MLAICDVIIFLTFGVLQVSSSMIWCQQVYTDSSCSTVSNEFPLICGLGDGSCNLYGGPQFPTYKSYTCTPSSVSETNFTDCSNSQIINSSVYATLNQCTVLNGFPSIVSCSSVPDVGPVSIIKSYQYIGSGCNALNNIRTFKSGSCYPYSINNVIQGSVLKCSTGNIINDTFQSSGCTGTKSSTQAFVNSGCVNIDTVDGPGSLKLACNIGESPTPTIGTLHPESLSNGAIGGIVIGVLLGLAFLSIAIIIIGKTSSDPQPKALTEYNYSSF